MSCPREGGIPHSSDGNEESELAAYLAGTILDHVYGTKRTFSGMRLPGNLPRMDRMSSPKQDLRPGAGDTECIQGLR